MIAAHMHVELGSRIGIIGVAGQLPEAKSGHFFLFLE